jgi:uncharacterized surface protein with fasciclin (FAS1) repeats
MKPKTLNLYLALGAFAIPLLCQCGKSEREESSPRPGAVVVAGQSAVQDDVSQPDVVKIAVGSPDHTTLVAVVKAAKLVDALTNAGPFTVFAPTNAAFDKLPAGTVENLLKPENLDQLDNILQYHVTVSTFQTESLRDGMTLSMAQGGRVAISHKDGKIVLNDSAVIVGSVNASNGIVHVIDGVLLPQ